MVATLRLTSQEDWLSPKTPRDEAFRDRVLEWNAAAHPFRWTPKPFEKVLAKVDAALKAAA